MGDIDAHGDPEAGGWHDAKHHAAPLTGWGITTFILLADMFGLGSLTLPSDLARLGWILGIGAIVLAGVGMMYTGVLCVLMVVVPTYMHTVYLHAHCIFMIHMQTAHRHTLLHSPTHSHTPTPTLHHTHPGFLFTHPHSPYTIHPQVSSSPALLCTNPALANLMTGAQLHMVVRGVLLCTLWCMVPSWGSLLCFKSPVWRYAQLRGGVHN